MNETQRNRNAVIQLNVNNKIDGVVHTAALSTALCVCRRVLLNRYLDGPTPFSSNRAIWGCAQHTFGACNHDAQYTCPVWIAWLGVCERTITHVARSDSVPVPRRTAPPASRRSLLYAYPPYPAPPPLCSAQ